MARGAEAKQNIIAGLKRQFGEQFLGESGGKYYILTEENGEPIQIAVSLTCPLKGIPTDVTVSNVPTDPTPAEARPSLEISQEERDNIETLMRKLNI